MTSRDNRLDTVLEAVVRLYSRTGQPVSSALVVQWLGGAVSSATVRGDMGLLERDGYLAKPHVSAGRVPTDAGFRAFVNRLLVAPPGEATAGRSLRALVDRELERSRGTHAMVKALAALLCRLTDNIGIILGPAWDQVRARRLDLYPKEQRRVLMVLVLDNALVRTGTFAVDLDVTPEALDDAARILSERISGRTIDEIRHGVLASLDTDDSDAGRIARDVVRNGASLFDDVEAADLELMGVANVLDEPEFSDPGQLKRLVKFLESPREIRSALRRLSPENEDGIAVWIGSENPIGELQAFSLVSSPFLLGERRGVLAVLGLRRMSYDRTIAGMQVLIQGLKQLPRGQEGPK